MAASFDLGGRHHDSHGSRGASRLVTRCGYAGKEWIYFSQEAPELALLAVELSREIAYMGNLNVARFKLRSRETTEDNFLYHRDDIFALFHPVSGEIRLIASQKKNWRVHGV